MSNRKLDEVVMMHCQLCGHTQQKNLGTCQQCGTDMGLYGKPVKVKVELPSESKLKKEPDRKRDLNPSPTPSSTPSSTTDPNQDVDSNSDTKPVRRIGPAIIGLVCVALLLMFGGKLMNSDEEMQPAETMAIETESNQTRKLQIPDFLAFANGFVRVYEAEPCDDYSRRCYQSEKDIWTVFDEYKSLLTTEYPYTEIANSSSNDDWDIYTYYYRYTGIEEVTDYNFTQEESQTSIKGVNLWLSYMEHRETGTVYVYISSSKNIVDVDNGDRSSLVPTTTESSGSWADNVLMADIVPIERNPISGKEGGDSYVFGNRNIRRYQVKSITFLDTLKDVPLDKCWDVSADQNGSVLAWAEYNSDYQFDYECDLFIVAEGGICAPESCKAMFYWYENVREINFNGCFHTDFVTDMEGMFYWCEWLPELDLSGFNTSRVTNMANMFYNSVAKLDLSSFDTSNVTDMHGMFDAYDKQEVLDISNFNTSKVTDMSDMFGFSSQGDLKELYLGDFDTSNVTDYSGFMDGEYLPDGRPWIELFEDASPSEPIENDNNGNDWTLRFKHDDITLNKIGQSYTFELTSDLQNDQVTWISSNEQIAKVDEHGTVTCTGWGTTEIIATYEDDFGIQTATCIVRCRQS